MAPSGPAGPSRGTLQTPRVAAAAAAPLGRCHGWGGAGFPSAGLNGLLRPEPRLVSPTAKSWASAAASDPGPAGWRVLTDLVMVTQPVLTSACSFCSGGWPAPL